MKKLTVTVDLEPIIKELEAYVRRKLKEGIKEEIEDAQAQIDFPDVRIHYPEMEKRIEKLEDEMRELKWKK